MTDIKNNDISSALLDRIQQVLHKKESIRIIGNNSRPYNNSDNVATLSTTEHTGIINYEPSELVIKVRAGTKIKHIQALLKKEQQQLGTDFPDYSESSIGGAIATGQTGSGRPFLGAIRDQVLGLGLINGKAQALNFGGQVMKNVAGYDVSRLLCGSQGRFALITDVTLKVMPLKNNITVTLNANQDALTSINQLAAQPLPITAAAILNSKIILRLSGSDAVTAQAIQQINAQHSDLDNSFWASLCNQQHTFFDCKETLWQIKIKATQKLTKWDENSLIDWCGHLRYIKTNEDLLALAEKHSFSALPIKNKSASANVQSDTPLSDQENAIKNAFDPHQLFI